jgi:acyl carrier protein
VNCSANTRLYGSKGQIDSITLVFLISELEEEVENTFGTIITLADEKAMSQQSSPFQSVDALASYIFKLVQSHE